MAQAKSQFQWGTKKITTTISDEANEMNREITTATKTERKKNVWDIRIVDEISFCSMHSLRIHKRHFTTLCRCWCCILYDTFSRWFVVYIIAIYLCVCVCVVLYLIRVVYPLCSHLIKQAKAHDKHTERAELKCTFESNQTICDIYKTKTEQSIDWPFFVLSSVWVWFFCLISCFSSSLIFYVPMFFYFFSFVDFPFRRLRLVVSKFLIYQ